MCSHPIIFFEAMRKRIDGKGKKETKKSKETNETNETNETKAASSSTVASSSNTSEDDELANAIDVLMGNFPPTSYMEAPLFPIENGEYITEEMLVSALQQPTVEYEPKAIKSTEKEEDIMAKYRSALSSVSSYSLVSLEASSVYNAIKESIPPPEFVKSTKMTWLVNDLIEHKKEKKLVFFTFLEEMHLVAKELGKANISFVKFYGGMSREDKDRAINNFQNTDISCMLLQIKCGGTGINLQAASRVYLTSPNYNPCVDLQAIGRAHRKGQLNKVWDFCVFLSIHAISF